MVIDLSNSFPGWVSLSFLLLSVAAYERSTSILMLRIVRWQNMANIVSQRTSLGTIEFRAVSSAWRVTHIG